jgi:hypothetical protein
MRGRTPARLVRLGPAQSSSRSRATLSAQSVPRSMYAVMPAVAAPVSSWPPPSPTYRHSPGDTLRRWAASRKSSGSGFRRSSSHDRTLAVTSPAIGNEGHTSASSVLQSLSTPTGTCRARRDCRVRAASCLRLWMISRWQARRAAQASASASGSGSTPQRRARIRNVAERSPSLPVARSGQDS